MTECFIGIGSNLDDPIGRARQALLALSGLPHSRLLAWSSLYRSAPMGPADQPDYVNGVAALTTGLEPLALLDALQRIEQQQGRLRNGNRWGPRTLDLDLLLYGDEVIEHPRLVVPHYGMPEREFVLYPLAEIAPSLRLPGGQRLSNLVEGCPRNGLEVLVEAAEVMANTTRDIFLSKSIITAR